VAKTLSFPAWNVVYRDSNSNRDAEVGAGHVPAARSNQQRHVAVSSQLGEISPQGATPTVNLAHKRIQKCACGM
jgi:hypothetical protein